VARVARVTPDLINALIGVIKASAAAFSRLIAETHQKNMVTVYEYYKSKGIYRSLGKTREFATKNKPLENQLRSSLRSDSPDRRDEYKDAIHKLSQLSNIAHMAGHEDDGQICESLNKMLFNQ